MTTRRFNLLLEHFSTYILALLLIKQQNHLQTLKNLFCQIRADKDNL